MQDRQALLEKKEESLQYEIEQWAKTHFPLLQGEELVVRLSLVPPPEKETLLNMEIGEYFNSERIRAAGTPSGSRIPMCIARIRKNPSFGIKTVGDFVSFTSKKIRSLVTNMGPKTIRQIEEILRRDGIEFRK